MIMDIVNVVPVGHCDRNASNEQKALYAEILTLRAKVEALLEALKYQRTRCEDIIDIRLIDEALATYDKLSEVSDDL